MLCPYCDNKPRLVTGDTIYPRRPDLHYKTFYFCRPCDAYVGCHEGTARPLGRLANAELRRIKIETHTAFDPLWQSGERKRKQVYHWLALSMGLTKKECHIGWFDLEQCQRAIKLCRNPSLSQFHLPSRSDVLRAQHSEQQDLESRFDHAISE